MTIWKITIHLVFERSIDEDVKDFKSKADYKGRTGGGENFKSALCISEADCHGDTTRWPFHGQTGTCLFGEHGYHGSKLLQPAAG